MLEQPFIFHIENASKAYNGVPALTDASLTLRGGEVHGLIGENGAGKSTFIKLLAGVTTPDILHITRNGKQVSITSATDAYATGLRFIHQELHIVPGLSVAENIFMSHAYPRRFGVFVDWGKLNTMAQAVLEQLGITHIDVRQNAGNLRVGDAMLMKIASAFVGDETQNGIYVMDEPTAALTTAEADILFAVIDRLREQGNAILYVTHRLDELFQIAQRVTVLRDGEVVGSNLIAAVTSDDLIQQMTGREMTNLFPPSESTPSDSIRLDVRDFQTDIIQDATFSLRAGEIVGVAGLNGSGRSELLRGLIGADTKIGGSIWLNGQALPAMNPAKAWQTGIAFVPEERRSQGLILTQSIVDNVVLPHLTHTSYGDVLLNRGRERQISQETGETVHLKAQSTAQHVKELSGGNQQKVVFARTMVQNIQVLLLDEPTRGIDVGAKYDIHRLIRQFAAQDIGILMVSSELSELLGMCDRILIMKNRRVIGEVEPSGLSETDLLRLCYGESDPA